MLTFNEGVPRSGKSYDAVATHILPAIKAGRAVYARLNGLHHARIAAHLSMEEAEVRRLLHEVDTSAVHEIFAAAQDDSGRWTIPAHLQNALFVIDEVHEFWVAGRQALEPRHEQFFALHGQNGMDGVIMTQSYKRLHGAIRARIERKNAFQKLTAVGMKGRYRLTQYVTIAPDKYEKVGGRTLKYDPTIFPLYAGYAPGATNTDVYGAGAASIWSKLTWPLVVAVVVVAFAVKTLVGFYSDGGGMVKAATAEPLPAAATQAARSSINSPSAALPVRVPDAVKPQPQLTPQQGYVYGLAKLGRVRLGGIFEGRDGEPFGVIEWRDQQGAIHESLTTRQLATMGVGSAFTAAGVVLTVGSETLIATMWPVQAPVREERAELYRLDRDDRRGTFAPSVSEPRTFAPGAAFTASSAGQPRIGSDYVPPEAIPSRGIWSAR